MRFKITVRGLGIELRGYTDQGIDEDQPTLIDFAEAMKPFGLVVASPAGSDYNPFAISEPGHPPTPDGSIDQIRAMRERCNTEEQFLTDMAILHYAQANVIRGERGRAERAEAELTARELHHFETEQIIEQVRNYIDRFQESDGWHGDIEDIRTFLGKKVAE
jgi:hypothetical protein